MRAADISLREEPSNDRTIDAQLSFGWYNRWQHTIYTAIANTLVSIRDDPRPAVRMGAMAPTMHTASRNETRYGQSECELRGILLGLETAGFTPRAIAVGDAPDALVTLDSGSVWVEHTEVVDPVSARYTNMMSALDRDVKDDVEADLAALAELTGHHLEFRLGACPTKSQVRGIRDAFAYWIRRGEHRAIPEKRFTTLTTPSVLKSVATSVTRAKWTHGTSGGSPFILHIQGAAHSFDPLSLAPIALRRLEVKQKLAAHYGVNPLWLIMTVTDLRGVWNASMAFLGSGCPSIVPYDRVIVCDPGRAIIWANGAMALRDARR